MTLVLCAVAWVVAGCFAILSGFITCYQVYNHAKYNSHPQMRRYVIRIILMVPIYALESWLGLRFADIALYFDLLRECYEAFVIYSFYQLLVTYLGGERALVAILAQKPNQPHVAPFCWLPAWRMSDRFQIQFTHTEMQRLQAVVEERTRSQRSQSQQEESKEQQESADVENGRAITTTTITTTTVTTTVTVAGGNTSPDFSAAASSPELLRPEGVAPERPVFRTPRIPPSYLSPYSRPHHSDFLTHTQLGTLQYCVAKLFTALLTFILSLLDIYGDSTFDYTRGYPYISFITNMSQIWAMYCLVLFYMVCKDDLKPLKPIPKFLCVKAVVFFTFWQSVLIAGLASLGVLHETTHYTKDQVVVALQDFVVCIEMLVAALAHHYAFSWKDFHDPVLHAAVPSRPMLPAILEALNVSDVYIGDVHRVTTKSLKKKQKDNRVLTREEMHEMQYASFIAATDGGALLSAGNRSDDLRQPLVEDSEDGGDDVGSSGYTAPTVVARGSVQSTGPGETPDIVPQEYHVQVDAAMAPVRPLEPASVTVTVAPSLEDDLAAPLASQPSTMTEASGSAMDAPSSLLAESALNGSEEPAEATEEASSQPAAAAAAASSSKPAGKKKNRKR